MSKQAKFSAKRMFEEIGHGSEHVLVGLVRPDAQDSSVVLCAPLVGPEKWVSIPEKLIKRYEALGRAMQGEEQLPVVRLFLAQPETAEGAIFAQATAPASDLSAATLILSGRDVGFSNVRPGGGTDCVFDRKRGDWFNPQTGERCKPVW